MKKLRRKLNQVQILHVRVHPETKSRLRELAEAERRTQTAVLEHLIEQAWRGLLDDPDFEARNP